ESEMGVQLLIRGPRGVRLTPAGVTLYESAVRMLAEAARLRQQLAIHPDQQTHHVTVGVSPTLAELLLPNLLERCFASEPELKVKAREGFTPELLSWWNAAWWMWPLSPTQSPCGGSASIRCWASRSPWSARSEEHTSELQSRENLVCRLLLEKKKDKNFI